MDKSFMLRHRTMKDKKENGLSESFLNTIKKDGKITGGKWTKDADGTSVFSPYGRMLSKFGSGPFINYFSENKPDVRLDINRYGLGDSTNIKKPKGT